MTNYINDCIAEIISIADGTGTDGPKLEQGLLCVRELLSSRPQLAVDVKDQLYIEATSGRHSQAARRLLSDVRAEL